MRKIRKGHILLLLSALTVSFIFCEIVIRILKPQRTYSDLLYFTGEQYRKLIFFFPNLFENFFLYCIISQRFAPKLMPKSIKHLAIILLILYIPKFAQEWALHFQQITPWNWFRETVLGLQPN